MPDFNIENKFKDKYKTIVGIDEAGRGCFAGPVVSASVFMYSFIEIESLNDSKQISPKLRDSLFEHLTSSKNIKYGIGLSDNKYIDDENILKATFASMHDSVYNSGLEPDLLLVDGNLFRSNTFNFKTVIKGDSKSQLIAAASIIAKVYRDRLMIKLSKIYPQYGFERNKGYGTKEHIEALKKYGPTEIHRKSFLTKIFSNQEELF